MILMVKTMVSAPIFDGKNHGFRLRFSQQNQSIHILRLPGERLTKELKNYAPVAAQCDIRVLKSKDQISASALVRNHSYHIDVPNSNWLINRGGLFIPLTTGFYDDRWYTKFWVYYK